ncbi:diguanylate cyclase [Patescibacteria group bacterium]|nr:diguanylate cyclase [Patescibacteria group bacterium]
MSEEKTAETLAKYNNAILIEQVALGILEQIHTQDPATLARQLAEKTLGDQETIKQLETELAALREQSDRDPYNPEIYSAHGWHRIMKDKLSELKRHNSSAWLLVFDLDGFKQYNDTNGHVEGDKALGLAGQLARSALRQEDAVARLHGMNF